jgi:MFS family permease
MATRWREAGVVWATIATLTGTLPGQTVLVSVFNPHLRAALDLSATELSLAYMGATLLAATPMTTVGRWSDRYGPRRLTIAVTIGFIGACIGMGWVRGGVGLFFGFLGLRLFGQSAMGMLSGHAAALWFERRLRQVEALRGAAMSVATTVLPPLVSQLVAGVGWRSAYPLLGIAVAVWVLPSVVWLQRDQPGAGRSSGVASGPPLAGMTLAQAWRTPVYWVLLAVGMLHASMGTGLLFFNLALAEASGLQDQVGAWGLSVFGGSILVSTGLVFVFGHRGGHRPWLIAVPVSLGCACVGVALAPSRELFLAAMGMLGLGAALSQAVLAPCVATVFGRRHHGAIRGSMMTSLVAGTALGPVWMGGLRDLTGSFVPPLLAVPLASLVLVVALARVSFDPPRAS